VSVPAYIAVLGLLAGCASSPAEDDSSVSGEGTPEPARGPFPSGDPEIDRVLRNLDSDDFATYAAAAHRLVVMGEAAIPALGRAADERENPDVAAVLRAILLRAEPARVGTWFDAPWAAVRAVAARTAGERRLTQHAPALVGLLEDESAPVRRAAVAALRRLSSRFFGFEPDAPAAARRKPVRRWKEFWGVPPDLGPEQRVSYDDGVKLDAAQWRQVLDQLEHGICLLDRDGIVRWANAAMERFGAEGLEERPFAEGVPALAGALDWAQAAASAIDRGRVAQLARQPVPGGMHVNCSLVRADVGEASLALLTVTDVSETVELEGRLLRQARTQAIANLGDSVAHEIRNPLNSIHMNVQLLREGLKEKAPDRERVDRTAAVVLREIKRLDGVVRDFVQFSRPPELRLEPGSVNHVIRAALDALDAQIREKDLQLEIDLQSARPVPMDRDRLQQSVYNVLLNAVQILPKGGRITCRTRDSERQCLVEIADDGPGLDATRCAHIFEVFYTTKAGGSGLGLPIANRIVEEHGGRMAVQSAPGRGATFAIFLPYDAPPPAGRSGPTAVPPGDGA